MFYINPNPLFPHFRAGQIGCKKKNLQHNSRTTKSQDTKQVDLGGTLSCGSFLIFNTLFKAEQWVLYSTQLTIMQYLRNVTAMTERRWTKLAPLVESDT